MKLEIRNVRGIADDEIVIDPGVVTPVRRLHGAGKTTLAACLAACLSRVTDPLELAPRTGLYVRKGAASDECFATLAGDGGWHIVWRPSAGDFTTSGEPPLVPEAVLRFGVPLMGGTKRDASRRWLDAMLPDPVTLTELEDELLGAKIDPVTAARIARQAIEAENGFEQAFAVADTQCREAKGKWADIASASDDQRRTYGKSIAASWRPKGWINELEGRGLSEIEQRLHDAREAERLLSDECARLEEQVRASERAKTRNEERQSHIASMRGELRDAEKLIGQTPEGHAEAMDQRDKTAAAVSTADHALREARRVAANLQDESDRRESQARHRASRIEELKERITRLTNDNTSYRDQQIAGLEQKIGRHEQDIERIDEEMEAIRARRKSITDDTETCTSCGQTLPDDQADDVKTRRLQIVDRDLAEQQGNREEAERMLGDARRNLDDVRADTETPPGVSEAKGELIRLENESDAASMSAEIAEARENVTKAERAYDDAAAARREAANRAEESERAVNRNQEIEAKVNRLRGRLQEAEAASDLEVPDAPSQRERDEANRHRMRAQDVIREEEAAVAVRKAYDEATAAQEEVLAWDRVRTILSPEKGIQARRLHQRAEEMLAAIALVNESILKAGVWLPVVDIDTQERKITVNDLPIEAASKAERWWAETVCRLGLAVAARSPVAIVEGADEIVPNMRDGYREAMSALAADKGMSILWTEAA